MLLFKKKQQEWNNYYMDVKEQNPYKNTMF